MVLLVLSDEYVFSGSIADGIWSPAPADIKPTELVGVLESPEWHLPLRELWGHLKEDISSLPWTSLFLAGALREVLGALCHPA